MQFKEVNLSDLPQCDVLAYSYGGHKLIGKLKNMANIVVCVTHDTSLSNISHYLPIDEIKPSEPKDRTFIVSITFMALKVFSQLSYFSSTNEIAMPFDGSLSLRLRDYLVSIKKEAADELDLPSDKLVQLSYLSFQ